MQVPNTVIAKSVAMPMVGLGTWELRGDAGLRVVQLAFELGYRLIDTAHAYENHAMIGEAIKGIERSQLFLTTKFTLPQLVENTVEQICDHALLELGTDYLDLFLLHYPDRSYDMAPVMHQMLALVEKQKVRAIGVSNFTNHHLEDLMDQNIHVAVNQVEFHPYLNQKELLDYCNRNQIHLSSYRSLGKGVIARDPIFEKMGRKHGKTATQIALRWLIEQNISVIPKSSTKEHLSQNLAIFDFTLDPDDRVILDQLNKQKRFCNQPWFDFGY